MAPIRPVPGPVTQLSARRVGDTVQIHFNVPLDNSDQSTPPIVSKVEIYGAPGPPIFAALSPAAIAVAPFALLVNDRPVLLTTSTAIVVSRFTPVTLSDPPGYAKPVVGKGKVQPAPTTALTMLAKKYLRGAVEVRPLPEPPKDGTVTPEAEPASPPPPDPAAPPPATVEDPRPLPGWNTTFVEQIPMERERGLKASELSFMRYVLVGITPSKRQGPPTAVLELPLGSELVAPSNSKVTYNATTLSLTWAPGAPAQLFRVYRSDPAGKEGSVPLNPAPLPSPTFSIPLSPPPVPGAPIPAIPPAKAEFDEEMCFSVRAVLLRGSASIESEAAGPVCVTPVDTFPPAAPAGLSGLPTENQIQLIWTPVPAADLAGYLVMRSDLGPEPAVGPSAEPKALMETPITETSYTDATVRPGGRYRYVVVAVDKVGNKSLPSNQVDEIR